MSRVRQVSHSEDNHSLQTTKHASHGGNPPLALKCNTDAIKGRTVVSVTPPLHPRQNCFKKKLRPITGVCARLGSGVCYVKPTMTTVYPSPSAPTEPPAWTESTTSRASARKGRQVSRTKPCHQLALKGHLH